MTLEKVDACPACGNHMRTLLYEEVPDFVFRATAEKWSVCRCDSCGSLYLPERPRPESMGAYYRRYYTHGSQSEVHISGIDLSSGMARRLANSWRNRLHGTARPSLGLLGYTLVRAVGPLHDWLEAESRRLPYRQHRGSGYRVLDIGFGDGRFLRFSSEAGCDAYGLEVDTVAVERAKKLGLNVLTGDVKVAQEHFGQNYFDFVSLSHVVEHVHKPQDLLKAIHSLLRPGGRLWVECPNPEGFGHALFGMRWRDLDTPRHLCIPTRQALRDMAVDAGFEIVEGFRRPFVPFEVYPFSAATLSTEPLSRLQKFKVMLRCAADELRASFDRRRSEWQAWVFRKV